MPEPSMAVLDNSTWQPKTMCCNYTAGQPQNRWVTYKRALQNLTVLMFSHYINHMENTGALEGHQDIDGT